MSKALVITATTDLSTLAPAAQRAIAQAYDALKGLEPSPARVRKAAVKVGAMRNAGVSVRGVVALLSVHGAGTLPTGKGTIERLGYVADAIAGEWPDTGDSADAILMALYRIAQTGRAADVARAAELGRKATTADDAFTAVDAVRRELNAAEHRALTTPANRPVAGEAADGGKTSEPEEAEAEPVTSQRESIAEAATLSRIGLTSLLAEVARRVQLPGFTPDDVLSAYAAEIAEAFENAGAEVLIED